MDISDYRKIKYEKRGHCMVCGKKAGRPLIDLPDFPMTEIYTRTPVKGKAGFADQGFYFCDRCGHGQMQNVIDIDLQYGGSDKYTFRTSTSRTARESTDVFLDFLKRTIKGRKFRTIVEIGCNDLFLLRSLKKSAGRLIGIDPILKGMDRECSESNITAIGDFYENASIGTKADMIICKDTLEHLSDPKQLFQKAYDFASDDAILFFEFPLLDALVASSRFDQVYHQHVNLFSYSSIDHILRQLGFELIDHTVDLNHLGSIIIAFKKSNNVKRAGVTRKLTKKGILESYDTFKSNMYATNKRLQGYKGETIYGYGAALMLPVLSYYMGNDLSCLKFVIDDDKSKEGLYYINLPVKIRTMKEVKDIEDSVVLVTAIASMNNVRRILQKLIELKPKHVILPLNTI